MAQSPPRANAPLTVVKSEPLTVVQSEPFMTSGAPTGAPAVEPSALGFAQNVLTQVDLTLGTNNSPAGKLSGGSTLSLLPRIGYHYPIGEGFVGASVGAEIQSHSIATAARQFLPSYQQVNAQVWLEGGGRVGPAKLAGGVCVEPAGSYSETPSHSTGDSAKVSAGFGGQLSLEVPMGPGSLFAGGRVFSRSLTFTGHSNAWDRDGLKMANTGGAFSAGYAFTFGTRR